jgi:heptosyltransferase-2
LERQTDRILIIRGGGIGDFILILPLLDRLKSEFPGAAVTIIGNPEIAELAIEGGFAENLYSLSAAGAASLFRESNPEKRDPRLRIILETTDRVICFLREESGILERNLRSYISEVRFVPPPGKEVHAAIHFIRASGLAINSINEIKTAIKLRPLTQKASDRYFRRFFTGDQPVVAVHPGSGSNKKNWPVNLLAETVRDLMATGMAVLLVEGEADRDICRNLQELAGPDLPVASCLPLALLGGILHRCRAMLGNDSGISHLAGAIGIPVLAIFGPTAPLVWRPIGPRVVIQTFDKATPESVSTNLIQMVGGHFSTS